jgi:hypothetical protein
MEYFNTYAFVHVAIYGCSYIEAAKRTWALVRECFWKAYFNDCLVGTTLVMMALGMSMLAGVVAAVVTGSVALGFVIFFLCLEVHNIVFQAVDSAVVTLFVCFAENPEALNHSAPELSAILQRADENGRPV